MSFLGEFQPSSPAPMENNLTHPDDAWIASILMSIRGMRDAARWLLAVVLGWLFLIPQLTDVRLLFAAERPRWVTGIGIFLLLLSVGRILLTVLEVQAPSRKRTYEVRNLGVDDLAYVQEWGVMVEPSTPAQWQRALAFNSFVWGTFQYMKPDEAQQWTRDHFGGSPPKPTPTDILGARDQLFWMHQQERNAILVLSQRDMIERFNLAKQSVLFFGFGAALALLVLLGPPV
jgi:hypothetical protein